MIQHDRFIPNHLIAALYVVVADDICAYAESIQFTVGVVLAVCRVLDKLAKARDEDFLEAVAVEVGVAGVYGVHPARGIVAYVIHTFGQTERLVFILEKLLILINIL